jgi:nucleoside 2-deoxyribosyltransferase
MFKIYLAARYSRREEMKDHAEKIEALGFEVTSRWVGGTHDLSKGGQLPDGDYIMAAEKARRYAMEDWTDLKAADLVVLFTDPEGSPAARGGKDVEWGMAIQAQKHLWLVGPYTNVFTYYAGRQFDAFTSALRVLVDKAEELRSDRPFAMLHADTAREIQKARTMA